MGLRSPPPTRSPGPPVPTDRARTERGTAPALYARMAIDPDALYRSLDEMLAPARPAPRARRLPQPRHLRREPEPPLPPPRVTWAELLAEMDAMIAETRARSACGAGAETTTPGG